MENNENTFVPAEPAELASVAGDRALVAVSTVAIWSAVWMWVGNSQNLATLYSAIVA